MRNIAVAYPPPTPRRASSPHPFRDWIATAPIPLLVLALLLPFVGAQATATPSVLISDAAIAALPTSGSAWSSLKAYADASDGTPDIADQDSANDVHTLAEALVYARTGAASYRTRALANLKGAVGTEVGGRSLALARNLPSYVIAADLIDLRLVDPAFDSNVFRPWLRTTLSETMSDGKSIRQIHEQRPNNWGTHAGAARAAVAVYLGDRTELARTAQVFRGWLGDRSVYAGFKYGSLSWQANPAAPVAIDLAGTGATASGTWVNLNGALPEEMRRGGTLQWPPLYTGYPWEAMQGAILQAEILDHAGYDTWSWSNNALQRAATYLYRVVQWPAVGDDTWQPWLIDARTGAALPRPSTTRPGKNFGFTDWLYGG
jgi:Alginate lyase